MVSSRLNSRNGNDQSKYIFEEIQEDELLIVTYFPDLSNLGSQIIFKELQKNLSKFQDFGCKPIVVSIEKQGKMDSFKSGFNYEFAFINNQHVKLISEHGTLGQTFGDGVIPKKYLLRTKIFNKNKCIIKEFNKVVPKSHYSEILSWIISTPRDVLIEKQTEVKETSQ